MLLGKDGGAGGESIQRSVVETPDVAQKVFGGNRQSGGEESSRDTHNAPERNEGNLIRWWCLISLCLNSQRRLFGGEARSVSGKPASGVLRKYTDRFTSKGKHSRCKSIFRRHLVGGFLIGVDTSNRIEKR